MIPAIRASAETFRSALFFRLGRHLDRTDFLWRNKACDSKRCHAAKKARKLFCRGNEGSGALQRNIIVVERQETECQWTFERFLDMSERVGEPVTLIKGPEIPRTRNLAVDSTSLSGGMADSPIDGRVLLIYLNPTLSRRLPKCIYIMYAITRNNVIVLILLNADSHITKTRTPCDCFPRPTPNLPVSFPIPSSFHKPIDKTRTRRVRKPLKQSIAETRARRRRIRKRIRIESREILCSCEIRDNRLNGRFQFPRLQQLPINFSEESMLSNLLLVARFTAQPRRGDLFE